MKCAQTSCPADAIVVAFWMGNALPSCDAHATKLVAVGQAMGINVPLGELVDVGDPATELAEHARAVLRSDGVDPVDDAVVMTPDGGAPWWWCRPCCSPRPAWPPASRRATKASC